MHSRLFKNIQEIPNHNGLVITQGTFDGVHLGHITVLQQVVKTAKALNKKSLLLTFHPHPRLIINPNDQSLRTLQSIEEKANDVFNIGIDYMLVLPFNKEIAEKSPEEFVKDILVDGLRIHTLIVGYDHRFGKHRSGGFADLKQLGATYHFQVQEIEANIIDQIAVSSSRIRKALLDNRLQEANQLLGKPYILTGMVESGKKLGRTIGFPTANLQLNDPYKLIPSHGVYAGYTYINGKQYKMVCNIGTQPTVEGNDVKIEAHILDFSGNLYNQTISLHLVQFLRPVQRFNSLDELVKQIQIDVHQTQECIHIA